ncbi:SMC-Scp complex subunit ScpB [Simiduia litorea]|uniref:SMC-Scp complex subunit ScpB n=1 Tax=Simiduia litorea TaxID=1435348 RepID=UPI0036F2F742
MSEQVDNPELDVVEPEAVEDAEALSESDAAVDADAEQAANEQVANEQSGAQADSSDDDTPVVKLPLDKVLLRKIIEGVLMAAGQPMNEAKIAELFDGHDNYEAPAKDEIKAALEDIQADCGERGFELKEVGSGWRFQVRAETAQWVNRLWDEKPQKYSRALLETLSLIAYRQPITRGDIEEIRGVAVSSHIIKTLSEREWVKVVGHRDVPGRPSLYATTRQFLDYFNLKSLDELPSLSELRDIEELNKEFDLTDSEDTEEAEGIKEAVAEFDDPADDDLADGEVQSEDAVADDENAEAEHASDDMFDADQQAPSAIAEGFAAGAEADELDEQHDDMTDDVPDEELGEPAFETRDETTENEQTESAVSATEPHDEDPNAV